MAGGPAKRHSHPRRGTLAPRDARASQTTFRETPARGDVEERRVGSCLSASSRLGALVRAPAGC
jgi:hypothetical protein